MHTNGIVQWFSCQFIPRYNRLPLVCYSNGFDVWRIYAQLSEILDSFVDTRQCRVEQNLQESNENLEKSSN